MGKLWIEATCVGQSNGLYVVLCNITGVNVSTEKGSLKAYIIEAQRRFAIVLEPFPCLRLGRDETHYLLVI